jgi:hypothetical protein
MMEVLDIFFNWNIAQSSEITFLQIKRWRERERLFTKAKEKRDEVDQI